MTGTVHLCEGCHRRTDLFYIRSRDAYLCDACASEPEPERQIVPPIVYNIVGGLIAVAMAAAISIVAFTIIWSVFA